MPTPPRIDDLRIESMALLSTRLLVWLWLCRLGRGKLAIFDGDPGLGKSLVTLDLCARISTGRPFPDNNPGPPPSNVLIFHGEDTAEDVVIPRLEALGADLSRTFHVHLAGDYGPQPLSFPGDFPLLDATLQRVHPLLVVIDPITAFLDPSVATANDVSVRRVLSPLAQFAEQHECAIILVRHLNKNAAKSSLYRGAGSMAFLAVCRSAWLFARHPSNKGQAVMAQVKNNLAPQQPSLIYEVVTRPDACPEMRWCGTSVLTATDLLKWADRHYPPRLRARCFLTEFLQAGPQPTRLIWEAAHKLGLSKNTINRAKKDLELRSQHTLIDGTWLYYWLLPEHKAPLSTDPEIRQLEERLEKMNDELPPENPLDEGTAL